MITIDQPNHDYMQALWERYERLKTERLSLDMTRGKPSPEQLDLSNSMLSDVSYIEGGEDCRNYSSLLGIESARKLCARYLGTHWKNTAVLGSSSLQLMYQVMAEHMLRGKWKRGAKFLCPVPGYDRHFTICQSLGIEMVPVPHTPNGPDMSAVRELIKDPSVVGIWCMPMYSNPTGISYHRGVLRELATMTAANSDFAIMWDNAYAVHRLSPVRYPQSETVIKFAKGAHTLDRLWVFGSFSKVTFASAGLAMVSTGPKSFEWFTRSLAAQTIGPDKLNQVRHVRFLKNIPGIRRHMKRHERLIKPKFEAVCEELRRSIGGKGVARWEIPDGGYFISMYLSMGSAKRTIELAQAAGLKLTPAGSAFPYGNDPGDNHIRIAPTYPPLIDVQKAAQVLGLCAEIAHRETHPQTKKRVA